MTSTKTDPYIIDTHPLVWYLLDDAGRLSDDVSSVLREAELGLVTVIIPAIVIAEAIYVGEKYQIPLTFQRLTELMRDVPSFIVRPLDLPVLKEMAQIRTRMEMHDRVIAATARVYGATVLTKDRAFEGVVETLW